MKHIDKLYTVFQFISRNGWRQCLIVQYMNKLNPADEMYVCLGYEMLPVISTGDKGILVNDTTGMS